MLSSPLGNQGLGGLAGADTRAGTYTYNDAGSTRIDHEGLVFSVPKHFPAIDGMRTEINLFAGSNSTDASTWTMDAGVTVQHVGAGWMRIQNMTSGSFVSAVLPVLLSGQDVEGRQFRGIVQTYNADSVNSGIKIRLRSDSGGTTASGWYDSVIPSGAVSVATAATVTTGIMTGNSGNVGIHLAFHEDTGSGDASDDFYVRVCVVEVTGRSNTAPPSFVPVDVADEYARELLSTLSGTGWTDNSDGTYTHSSGTTGLDQAVTLKTGRTMVAEVIITGRTAGTVTPKFTGGSGVDGSAVSADSWQILTVGSGNTTFSLVPTTDFDGTVTVSLKEAAPGVQQFVRRNANTVASGVITEVEGELLSPWHWETVRSGGKKTIRHQVRDQYTPWSATDSVVANERRLPTDWMTNYNRQLGFYAVGAGTTGGTEPDWSTATDPGDTVSDNGITWTAFWCTIRGFTQEPATTQDLATAAVIASGGSASTYPTSWGEVNDTAYVAVVGYGVSPVNPDFKYVDLQFSNSSGSNKSPTVGLDMTSATGVVQSDKVTMSVWTQVIAGTVQGSPSLSISERNSGDTHLSTQVGAVTVTGEMNRVHATFTLAEATVDRYRAQFRIQDLPDTADCTIRLTMPNSCQQGHVSSFIGTEATRTTQEGAMTYPLENWDNDNGLWFADLSFGVAVQDASATESLISVHATDTVHNILSRNSSDRLQSSDGPSFPGFTISDDVAGELFRVAGHLKDGANFGIQAQRAGGTHTSWTTSFDGSYTTTRDHIALCPSISSPVTFHGLRIMPGLDIQTAADVTQYHDFDDLRYV